MSGLFASLITGVSGLGAQSQALAAISDNIANASTIGYKRIDMRFSSLVTQSSPAIHSPGGVRSKPLQLIDAEGILLGSTSETDLAIDGDGFFSVTDQPVREAGDEFFFTRAGSFRPDEDGNLVNDAGFFLQGFDLTAAGGGTTLSDLQTVNIANITGNPVATSDLFLGATLPADAAAGDTVESRVTVFDSLGTDRIMTVTWTKGATANTWALTVSTAGADGMNLDGTGNTLDNAGGFDLSTLTGATPAAANQEFLRVTFNTDGTLNDIEDLENGGTILDADGNFGIDFDFTSAGSGVIDAANFNFGTPGETNGVVQFDVENPTEVRSFTQNGLAFGTAIGISIDDEGIVVALFDNGEQSEIYELPVIDFANPNALEVVTGNAFRQTANSGDFVIQSSGTGGVGKIRSFALEGSTVDIAEEFSDMIVAQRTYSANTRVVSTADEMIEELIRVTG